MKKFKRNMKNAAAAVTVLAVAVCSLSGCQDKTGSDKKTNKISDIISGNTAGDSTWDIPVPDGFSKKEQQQLIKIYQDAYNDEKQALEIAVMEAVQNFDEYGELKEDFKNALGTTEEFYQALNELDPNLKNVVSDEIAFEYGNTPLEYYLINKGVGTVLADNDTGRELRSMIEQAGLALAESFTIWAMESSQTTRKDAVMPVAVSNEYALVRSLGNINEMLEEIEIDSCYRIAKKVFDERQKAIGYFDESVEEYLITSGQEPFEVQKLGENNKGRQKAISEARKEWNDALYEWKSAFLNNLGIKGKDAELLIKASNQNDEYDYEEYHEIYGYYEDEMDGESYAGDDEETENINPSGYQYVYSIIDKNGKVYGSFLSAYSVATALINDDGMCSFTAYEDEYYYDSVIHHVIIDKDANVLFRNGEENGNSIVYDEVTPSGNVLKKTMKSDFEHGDYEVLEFVKQDGSAKKLMEGGYVNLSPMNEEEYSFGFLMESEKHCSDYYIFHCGYEDDRTSDTDGVIDMKTGKLITGDEYEEMLKKLNDQKLASFGVDVDMEPLGGDDEDNPLKHGMRINDSYVIYQDIVYDNSGKKVKELNAGRGVKNILYADGYYWIVSNSGWYYVLDDDFKQILEPVKFDDDIRYSLTGYGLMVESVIKNDEFYSGETKFTLYDEKGNAAIELQGEINLDGNTYGFIFGNEKVGWVNLNTKEMMLITVSGKKIHTLEF